MSVEMICFHGRRGFPKDTAVRFCLLGELRELVPNCLHLRRTQRRSCHTINCGSGFGLGLAFTGGAEGLAVGELEAFAGLGLTVGVGPLVVVSGLAPVK
jgi:hypothetical protein